jgi:pimeloyl-ACP methyl ester carboxylesterase
MASTKRLLRSFYRLFLPTIVLVLLATIAAAIWLVHEAANPQKSPYLMTPEKYGKLSTRAAQVTDETWTNRDGTTARGWLLRGSENAPAVILLHRYGADRSWILDLGVKLNETTNFTVLMPDARGHGESPLVKTTSLGGSETEDVLAAIDFLRSLKNYANTGSLVGKDFGVYGVELGAYSGLQAAVSNENIKALALDSIPLSSDEMLSSAISKRYPFASAFTSKIAGWGTYLYYFNDRYNHQEICPAAKSLTDRKILLLAGTDAPQYQNSTKEIQYCLPNTVQLESNLNLTPSGYGINRASIEQAAAYDQRVIDFFKRSLGGDAFMQTESVEKENMPGMNQQ